MKVKKILGADIYRDGGSYGFWFDSDDGHWYEFFLRTRALEEPPSDESHLAPVLFLEGVNNRKVVKEFTWAEAKSFVAPLEYEDARFYELVAIVVHEAKRQSPRGSA